MVYTLTLNPSLDYVMYPAAYLKKGGTNRSEREELRAGGKGINVSVVLKNLDVPTRALGFIAGATGDEIEGTLRSIGIMKMRPSADSKRPSLMLQDLL